MLHSQKILLHSRDNAKLEKIRNKLKQPGGGLHQGIIPSEEWGITNLGDTFHKVILASNGVESLSHSDITVLGGWCALRTNCMLAINNGKLNNLHVDEARPYKSIDDVVAWLKNAISADQIVESIGFYNGTEYAAISEVKLWSNRVIHSVEAHMKTTLDMIHRYEIENAIALSEERRYEITKKYIEQVVGKSVNFVKVIDRDIFDDLVRGRDELLKTVGTSVEELAQPIFNNRIKSKGHTPGGDNFLEQDVLRDLARYVDSYSLVWFMYTGPYVEILKSKGYVKTEKTLILEPWSHAVSNEGEEQFNLKVFYENKGRNNYLKKGGLNENVGFIGIDEVSYYNWKKVRTVDPVSRVPNILNYKDLLSKLKSSAVVGNLDLTTNQIFQMGVNYYPYNGAKEIMEKMIDVRIDWLSEKKEHQTMSVNPQEEVTSVKGVYTSKMKGLERKLIEELDGLFNFLFA